MRHIKKITIPALLATVTLSACGVKDLTSPPEFSNMEVSEKANPEINRVQIPMPEAPEKPILERAQSTSLWQHNSDGFFKDQRAQHIGDVLTVHIEISDKASLKNETDTQRTSANQVGFPTFFGYQNKIAKVLPGISAEDLPGGGNVIDLDSNSSQNGSGSVARNEKISLKVAALVIEKLPNGTMVIAGRQEVRVNHELRELRVAGIVRQQDISSDNTISYDKIAEARIAYGGRGLISDAQRPAYGKRMLDIVLPY